MRRDLSLEQERADVVPGAELAEVIIRQHAFGKTIRALSIIHKLPQHVIRRVINEHEQQQLQSQQRDH